MPDNSNCVVHGDPVASRKYVLCVPCREVPEGQEGKADVVWNGKRWQTPKPTTDEREGGAKFASLSAEVDDIVAALDIDERQLYELRHNPPRILKHVPVDQVANIDVERKRAILVNGRAVKIERFLPAEDKQPPRYEVDFGVLQKIRCGGDQVLGYIANWRQLLIDQLLEKPDRVEKRG